MPVPAGTADGDLLVAVVANAGTAGPATPTGWTLRYGASAGSGQFCAVFTAPYSAGLTRAFTNAASAAVAVCGAYYEAGRTMLLDGAAVATVNTTNNTTLPTGAPTTGTTAGDFEVLAYAHTAAPTVTTTATGSTIDLRAVNGTACTAILGHNNTTSLGASTACVAFSHTLSANQNRKTGVGVLLRSVIVKELAGAAAGGSVPAGEVSKLVPRDLTGGATGSAGVGADLSVILRPVRDLTGAATGRGQIGTAFLWGGGGTYGTAVWGSSGVTVITGGPLPPGPKDLYAIADGVAVASGAVDKAISVRDLTGASAGIGAASASPARRRPLVAASAGVAVEVGTVTARRRLVAAADGVATAAGFVDIAGSIFRPLFGGSVGRATAAGSASRRRALAASSLGRATLTASPSRRRPLASTAVLGRATTTALLQRKRALASTSVVGRATAAGVVSILPQLPLTSVIWVVDHFEMSRTGTLVLWGDYTFLTSGDHAQVIWEEDEFKVYQP